MVSPSLNSACAYDFTTANFPLVLEKDNRENRGKPKEHHHLLLLQLWLHSSRIVQAYPTFRADGITQMMLRVFWEDPMMFIIRTEDDNYFIHFSILTVWQAGRWSITWLTQCNTHSLKTPRLLFIPPLVVQSRVFQFGLNWASSSDLFKIRLLKLLQQTDNYKIQ